jgi:hypothetical protein
VGSEPAPPDYERAEGKPSQETQNSCEHEPHYRPVVSGGEMTRMTLTGHHLKTGSLRAVRPDPSRDDIPACA